MSAKRRFRRRGKLEIALRRAMTEERHETGRASADPAKLADAASLGRIDMLMLSASPSCWEQASPGSPAIVPLGADDTYAHCELVDRIAVDTLTNGGRIHAFSETPVPGDGDIAAVFRY